MVAAMSLTLGHLIEQYRTDADSHFMNLSYRVRVDRERTLARIYREHGNQQLRNIRNRTLIAWHRQWIAGGKLSMARSLVDRMRELLRFGSIILEDRECSRLLDGLAEVRPQKPVPSPSYITRAQACAICTVAREHFGWHSIALAQALQFELPLSQKDVIGEWVPIGEAGTSDVVADGQKWLRGLRWSAIDDKLILRHAAGSGNKFIEIDLKTAAPMVLAEFEEEFGSGTKPESGPVILCDTTGLPWSAAEFRRKWRLVAAKAGVPDSVKNRSGVART
jgi:hypothetical protein